MDNNINVNICAALTWVLWGVGAVTFVGVAFEVFPLRFHGIGFMTFSSGCVLFMRRIIRDTKAREQAAYEFGRLSASVATNVRSMR